MNFNFIDEFNSKSEKMEGLKYTKREEVKSLELDVKAKEEALKVAEKEYSNNINTTTLKALRSAKSNLEKAITSLKESKEELALIDKKSIVPVDTNSIVSELSAYLGQKDILSKVEKVEKHFIDIVETLKEIKEEFDDTAEIREWIIAHLNDMNLTLEEKRVFAKNVDNECWKVITSDVNYAFRKENPLRKKFNLQDITRNERIEPYFTPINNYL